MAALFSFVQRGEEVFLRSWLVSSSFSLCWSYKFQLNVIRSSAALYHMECIERSRSTATREMKGVCVFTGATNTVCLCVCTCSLQMPRHPACLHPASPWLRWVWYVLDVTPTLQHSGPPPDRRMSVCACVCVYNDKDTVTFKVPWCQLTIQTRLCIPTRWPPPPFSFSLSLLSLINVSLPFSSHLFSSHPPLSSSLPPVLPHHMETITAVVVSHHQHYWGLSRAGWLYINLVLSPCSHCSS